MNGTRTEIYEVENATPEDLEHIYWLFEQAIAYQKTNNYVGWNNYDKDFIKLDIANKLQFKIVKEKAIICIFSICFTDELIWREMEKGDAVYLHRVVIDRAFKGQKQFEKILNWMIAFAEERKLKYIRMDTWADNLKIIEYYKSYGFRFIENYTTANTPHLPEQNRNLKVSLLEFEL